MGRDHIEERKEGACGDCHTGPLVEVEEGVVEEQIVLSVSNHVSIYSMRVATARLQNESK